MTENTHNETNWKNRDLPDTINGLMQCKSRWHLIISPTIYLVFLCLLLLSDMETVDLIIKQSYGYRLIKFTVISFLPVLPAEYLFIRLAKIIGRLKKKYTEKEDPVFENLWVNKILFIFIYIVIAHMNYDSMEYDINQSKTTPRQIVRTVISDIIIKKRGKHDEYYMEFEINGEKHRYQLSEYIWREYNVGDAISVTYRIGCLNWIIYDDIHHLIVDRNIYNEKTLEKQKNFKIEFKRQ